MNDASLGNCMAALTSLNRLNDVLRNYQYQEHKDDASDIDRGYEVVLFNLDELKYQVIRYLKVMKLSGDMDLTKYKILHKALFIDDVVRTRIYMLRNDVQPPELPIKSKRKSKKNAL